jgi:hypothetical protein
VDLALIVIPDLPARFRIDRADGKQVLHSLRLEDAALRIDERDALSFELKAAAKIVRSELVSRRHELLHVHERSVADLGVGVALRHEASA